MHLGGGGGGGDDEEGGAVGCVPLCLIVNLSRVARELEMTRRDLASPGSCGADAHLRAVSSGGDAKKKKNGFNKQR